ncbi:MAG: nidogen-like domain-containing protein [Paracoccaceae bacterium]
MSLIHRASLAAAFLVVGVAAAQALAVRPGFETDFLAANDDGSSAAVTVGFDLNFFGVTRSSLFVNNNGNVTLDSALSTFTPFDLTSTSQEIIAPFFADVDTTGTGTVGWAQGTVGARSAFGVTWRGVGYFNSRTDKTNTFQLVLIDRSDTGAGNFDIEFNYDRIEWETGEASEGVDGLGGFSARAGYSNGTGDPGSFFELAGSAVNGAFLDSGPTATALIFNSIGSEVDGRYVFNAREGSITEGPETPEAAVPLPAAAPLLVFGLAGFAALRRRR